VEIDRGDADVPPRGPGPAHGLDQAEPADGLGDRTLTGADSKGVGDVLGDPERIALEHQAYRATVERDYAAGDRWAAAGNRWSEAVPELRDGWEKIREKYGYAEASEEPAPRETGDGAWHGQGGRTLDAAQNDEVDRGYARIREVGEQAIIPGVLSVEGEDAGRRLAGFDHCFKGIDRLKEKIVDEIRSTPGTTASQALAVVPDAVRFTYLYSESGYTVGTQIDVDRLEARGFVQVERRNTWASDQYKGINARWREPESGVIFEVQFHTQASLEAKELTHKAYERIRSMTEETQEADREAAELKGFQREVNANVPIPPGVIEYEDYRPERRNVRGD
jgi:hypothetical protein